jgi:hypothetical protein
MNDIYNIVLGSFDRRRIVQHADLVRHMVELLDSNRLNAKTLCEIYSSFKSTFSKRFSFDKVQAIFFFFFVLFIVVLIYLFYFWKELKELLIYQQKSESFSQQTPVFVVYGDIEWRCTYIKETYFYDNDNSWWCGIEFKLFNDSYRYTANYEDTQISKASKLYYFDDNKLGKFAIFHFVYYFCYSYWTFYFNRIQMKFS